MNLTTTTALPSMTEPSAGNASPQLVRAANSFEANFLGELLKPMREDPLFGNGNGFGGDGLGSDGPNSGSMGTIGSLASESLAQAIVKQGGMGIARMVLAQLAPAEQAASQAATAGTGTACGDCAQHLTMTPEAGAAIEAGSVAMLGEGNLSASGGNQPTRISQEKPARGTRSMVPGDRALSVEILHPTGSLDR